MNHPQNADGSATRSAAAAAAAKREGVVEALRGVERGERDSLDRLRAALCEFVGTLRAEGRAPEEVTRTVAELIMTPGDAAGAASLLGPAREALVELTHHWCLEELAKVR